MADTLLGRQLTEAHRIAQGQVARQTAVDLLALWPMISSAQLDATFPRFAQAALAAVQLRRKDSAALAAAYYRAFRDAEAGLTGRGGLDFLELADRADSQQVQQSLMVTGPVQVKLQVKRGVPVEKAMRSAAGRMAAAGTRHALDGGRETLVGATKRDDAAQGWARVASGKACALCGMLASRAVLTTAKYETPEVFETHDGCSCTMEPIFSVRQSPPPTSRMYADLWEVSGASSHGGKAALNTFRRALERPALHLPADA